MTREEIREHITGIIRDIVPDEDFAELDDELPIRDQVALDSMDFLDIVLELRKRHGVMIPEDDYQELRTVASAIDYLAPRLSNSV